MKFGEIFHILSRAFKKEKIPCLLIGGFAVNYYHVTRQTLDVDFLTTSEDFKKIRPVLRQAGYRDAYVRKIFVRLDHKSKDMLDLDFLFADHDTLREMIRYGKKIKLAGEVFTIPSLDHLLALKLHALKSNPGRRLHRDLADVIDLIRLNKINYRAEKFKALCLKYADEKILRAIAAGLKHDA